jgi:hypothetical protein
VQEFGASEEWMDAAIIPEFMERSIRSAAASGARWFTWWCSHDITRDFQVEDLEYTLGLLTTENEPKPQAETFRRMAEEYREKDPAEVDAGYGLGAPPSAPKSTESTWHWLESWIDALPPQHPGM